MSECRGVLLLLIQRIIANVNWRTVTRKVMIITNDIVVSGLNMVQSAESTGRLTCGHLKAAASDAGQPLLDCARFRTEEMRACLP